MDASLTSPLSTCACMARLYAKVMGAVLAAASAPACCHPGCICAKISSASSWRPTCYVRVRTYIEYRSVRAYLFWYMTPILPTTMNTTRTLEQAYMALA